MTNYEVLYIISPKADNKKCDEIIEKFSNIVTTAGGTTKVTKLGLKKLAYEIKFVKEGFFVLMEFSASEDIPAEIERQMRITDEIFRFLVTKKVENKLTRKEAAKREEQAKRNEAREKEAKAKAEEVISVEEKPEAEEAVSVEEKPEAEEAVSAEEKPEAEEAVSVVEETKE